MLVKFFEDVGDTIRIDKIKGLVYDIFEDTTKPIDTSSSSKSNPPPPPSHLQKKKKKKSNKPKKQIKKSSTPSIPVYLQKNKKISKKAIGRYRAIAPYKSRAKNELSFKTNDIFIVFKKRKDGWFDAKKEDKNSYGLIPSNYMRAAPPKEINLSKVLKEKFRHRYPIGKCKALYKYKKKKNGELTIVPGDIVAVFKKRKDGWFVAKKDGVWGLVPGNYVRFMRERQMNIVEEERKRMIERIKKRKKKLREERRKELARRKKEKKRKEEYVQQYEESKEDKDKELRKIKRQKENERRKLELEKALESTPIVVTNTVDPNASIVKLPPPPTAVTKSQPKTIFKPKLMTHSKPQPKVINKLQPKVIQKFQSGAQSQQPKVIKKFPQFAEKKAESTRVIKKFPRKVQEEPKVIRKYPIEKAQPKVIRKSNPIVKKSTPIVKKSNPIVKKSNPFARKQATSSYSSSRNNNSSSSSRSQQPKVVKKGGGLGSVYNPNLPRKTNGSVSRVGGFKGKMLAWVRRWIQSYNVEVLNLHKSFSDGIAFCAIIHKFNPSAFDFSSLLPSQKRKNLELAFGTASKYGIPDLLDPEDILDFDRPDDVIIATYLSEVYKYYQSGKWKSKSYAAPSIKIKTSSSRRGNSSKKSSGSSSSGGGSSGRGKMSYESGEKLFEGELKNGKRVRGVQYWKDGGKQYEGGFKNGEFHGKGTYYYPSGEVYKGSWKNGKKEGKGDYSYIKSEFLSYSGDWKSNEKHGEAILYYNPKYSPYGKGSYIECIWKNNQLVKIKKCNFK